MEYLYLNHPRNNSWHCVMLTCHYIKESSEPFQGLYLNFLLISSWKCKKKPVKTADDKLSIKMNALPITFEKKKKKVTQKRGVILILVYIKMNTEEIQLIRHKNCSHNNSQALSIFTRVSFPLLRSWYAVVMLSEEAFFYHLLLQYTFDYCWVTLCGLKYNTGIEGRT